MGFGIQGTTDATSVWQQQQQNGQSLRPFTNLDLSEQQRTQIRSVFQNAKSQGLTQAQVKDQIDAILTPDQQATLQADRAAQSSASSQSAQTASSSAQNGSAATDPFANLDLSAQQQTQVQQILQQAKASGQSWSQTQTQINAVLTPAQQQTFQSDVQNAQSANSGHHHHHHHGAGGSSSSSSDQTASSTASSSTSTSGLTETDVQNQVLAAAAINQQQIQNDVFGL